MPLGFEQNKVDTSDLKRLILRGSVVGAIAGLILRFVGKDMTDSEWLEALPFVGIFCGALFSWRIGKEIMKSEVLNPENDEPNRGM